MRGEGAMRIARTLVSALAVAGLAAVAGPLFAQAAPAAPSPPAPARAPAARPRARAATAASTGEDSPRAELERLRSTLEAAIARPGPAGFFNVAASGQVYRLKGYGAVIVLSPRRLPMPRVVLHKRVVPRLAPPQVTVDVDAEVSGPMDLAQFERDLETQMAAQAAALREMEQVQSEWTRASADEVRRSLRQVEDQAEAFRQEAERARQEAERDVRTRLSPPAPAAEAPEPPEAPLPPEMPEPPPPPWRFWFDAGPGSGPPEAGSPGDAKSAIADARQQLAAALSSYAGPIAALGRDESISVAVDFVAAPPRRTSPTRTLVVRVRAGDLRDRQAGRLSAADLRNRLEFDEQDD